MSTQTELRAIVSAELADELEAYFFETETAYWGVMQRERNDPYEVFGFFPDEDTADAELAELRKEFPSLPDDFALSTMEDSYWQNAYKEFVKPWSDRQLNWIPLWERENIQISEGDVAVYLDAGMAFGTGAHETTRLCARRLLDYLDTHPGSTDSIDLFDAGCGSGILALSAAVLGFKNLYAFDFDPEAIRVCHENVDYNPQIPAVVDFAVADLEAGLKGRQADFMMANIQTDVLIPFSDPVVMAIKDGGTLALSGILTKELDQVRNHYEERFAELRDLRVSIDSREDGEWGDLLIQLPE
ncbi:50S ribosomal protein L11 methyltransferase [Coraliomargarita akajimensis]|uniref:Ribosomal protein L11 methyltransferase n=1 Tax=Coraliomargarita akajimensis (strain DSM 45221 / IAM 15411 / JCM 23193 / KCTC 12865 / 04OKA010-24) TaxID=583355 RepID=D5ELE0_CORAD|nr:50S ribosomal protein L11 methyltransferase [Coraliomargarita akajimensis]ADE55076.1 ribosomal L11 methyltransferase [Coraliomargarita akajimensis DSM 45221]